MPTVDEIYALYPGRCIDGRSTGKCMKNKKQIETIIRKGGYDLVEAIPLYLRKTNPLYLLTFSHFLERLPDIDELKKDLDFQDQNKPTPKPDNTVYA